MLANQAGANHVPNCVTVEAAAPHHLGQGAERRSPREHAQAKPQNPSSPWLQALQLPKSSRNVLHMCLTIATWCKLGGATRSFSHHLRVCTRLPTPVRLTGSAVYALSTLARYHCWSALYCATHLSPAFRGACTQQSHIVRHQNKAGELLESADVPCMAPTQLRRGHAAQGWRQHHVTLKVA